MTLYIFYEKPKKNKNKQKNYTRYATLLPGTPSQHTAIPLERVPSIPNTRKTSCRIRTSRKCRSSIGRSRRCRLVCRHQRRNHHRLVGRRLGSRRSRLGNLSKGVIPRCLTDGMDHMAVPIPKVVYVVGEHFEQLKSVKGDISLRLE